MKITFSPIRSDAELTLARAGDILIINGASLNLTALPKGATLPREAVASEWIAGPIERDFTGRLHIPIVLPHGPDAPQSRRFPDPITVTADGPITLPPNSEALE